MKTAVVVSDIHVPNHDPVATRTFLKFVRKLKPDVVVLNGDILDLAACSSHGDADSSLRLEAEFAAGNVFLDDLTDAAPGARFVYNEGNHETRLQRFVAKNAPVLGGIISVPKALDLDGRGVEWREYDADSAFFLTPKLAITHGFAHGSRFTEDTLRKYNVSVIVGHAHRPQYTGLPTLDVDGQQVRGCWGSGCLVPVSRVPYLNRPSGWTQGWTVVYFDEESFSVYPVNLHGGRCFWNGHVFGGAQ